MGCDSDPSSPTQPQPPTYTLSGTVTDLVTRRGVPGASVAIESGPSQASTATNSSGSYALPGLQAGAYAVSFAAAGYARATGTATISGTDVTLNADLTVSTPANPTTTDLTGTWSGTGTYPNAPFRLIIVQQETTLSALYQDQHDQGRARSGAALSGNTMTLVIDFGDAGLEIVGTIDAPREMHGTMRTPSLGNFPHRFSATR